MSHAADVLRDERRRIENLIEQSDLWTQRRLPDGRADGPALGGTAGPDPTPRLRKSEYRARLERATGDVHRRFQVRTVRIEPRGGRAGAVSGGVQQVIATFRIVGAVVVAKGNAYCGTWDQGDEVATQDAERVRQILEHDANRDRGEAEGVDSDGCDGVLWLSTLFEDDEDEEGAGRIYWRLEVTSYLTVTTEPSQATPAAPVLGAAVVT